MDLYTRAVPETFRSRTNMGSQAAEEFQSQLALFPRAVTEMGSGPRRPTLVACQV